MKKTTKKTVKKTTKKAVKKVTMTEAKAVLAARNNAQKAYRDAKIAYRDLCCAEPSTIT